MKRRGFTLVELIVTIAIASIFLFPVLLALVESVRGVRTRLSSTNNVQTFVSDLEGLVRRDLFAAGYGLVTTPNIAGVMVRTGGTPEEAQDTLLLLTPTSQPWSVSTRPCTVPAPTCVRLVGNATDSIAVDDLLLIAAPTLGGSVVQVTALGTTTAPCGADCPTPPAVCSETIGGPLQRLRLVGSREIASDGTPGGFVANVPCDSTLFGDGRRCQEAFAIEPVDTIRVTTCGAPADPTVTYTEVTVADRTTAAGWPAPPASAWRSGPDGAPLVTAQSVRALRYTRSAGTDSLGLLRRNVGLDAAGAWNDPELLGNRVQQFLVRTLHLGDSTFTRGPGYTAAMLALNPANLNYTERTSEGVGADSAAWAFIRSGRTLAGLEVWVGILPANPGARTSERYQGIRQGRFTIAIPQWLRGGAPFPRRVPGL